ncbi:maleylpyruvate isomerase N-terminal domain-containing protein [Alloalcanivorax gelatiniphagus]
MTALLVESYDALADAVSQLRDQDAWAPTGCTGWSVHDLVWHLHADAVRGLVAAHTPAGRAPDCDAVGYWRSWGSDPEADERNRRLTRVESGLHTFAELRERHLEACAAARRAVIDLPAGEVLATQGHALRADDLASTLAVEATLHHLDLVAHLDATLPPPSTSGIAEVRRIVEALLPVGLAGWSDERVALVGTGRATPTDDELGHLRGARLPVFS